MKPLFTIFFVCIFTAASLAQSSLSPGDPGFLDQYIHFDFKGNFASHILSEEESNYFLVDLTKIPSRFDRIYFMNLSFSAIEIVNVDFNVNKKVACFKGHIKYSQTTILAKFDELLTKTLLVSSTSSADQKEDWLKINDKYHETKMP